MLLSVFFVILGLVLLVLGGEVLLKGSVGLATILKLTPAVIGLTVVAAGTSVPELAVSAIATANGNVDIAVANVVGSNIFNIAFILGLCAVISPILITGNTIKLEYPVLALVTMLCLAVSQDGNINRIDAMLFLLIYISFTAYLVAIVRKQTTEKEATVISKEVKGINDEQNLKLSSCLFFVVFGIALLGGGAHYTVKGAVELARILGWSERIIGLTIVSMGTSLPEVFASVISGLRGRSDMAVGNIIGSNLFNILMILGISGLFSPLSVNPTIISYDSLWMLGITFLLFPLMFTGARINRYEGALMLAVYSAYLGLLIVE